MADLTLLDREEILRTIRAWPPDEQRARGHWPGRS